MRLRLGHSPDPDDAFLTYAIVKGKVETVFEIVEVVADIEVLNRLVLHERLDVSAVSAYAYLKVSDRYLIVPYGASIGYGYGPRLILRTRSGKVTVGVPGLNTTARALLELYMREELPYVEYRLIELPYELIGKLVIEGVLDGGVLIHEEQMLSHGMPIEVDLGRWWYERSGLPIPLGLNVVRKDLGEHVLLVVELYRRSVEYALRNIDEVLEYAIKFSRVQDRELVRRFVLMYVKENLVQEGTDEFRGLEKLAQECYRAGLLDRVPRLEVAK